MSKEYDIVNDEPQMANEPTAAYKMWILLLYYLPTWCRYWIVSQGWGAKKSWRISVWRDFMLGKYCLCVSGYKKRKRKPLSILFSWWSAWGVEIKRNDSCYAFTKWVRRKYM